MSHVFNNRAVATTEPADAPVPETAESAASFLCEFEVPQRHDSAGQQHVQSLPRTKSTKSFDEIQEVVDDDDTATPARSEARVPVLAFAAGSALCRFSPLGDDDMSAADPISVLSTAVEPLTYSDRSTIRMRRSRTQRFSKPTLVLFPRAVEPYRLGNGDPDRMARNVLSFDEPPLTCPFIPLRNGCNEAQALRTVDSPVSDGLVAWPSMPDLSE